MYKNSKDKDEEQSRSTKVLLDHLVFLKLWDILVKYLLPFRFMYFLRDCEFTLIPFLFS